MTVSGIPNKEQNVELLLTGTDKDGHSASTPLQVRVKEGFLAQPSLVQHAFIVTASEVFKQLFFSSGWSAI